MHSKPPTTTTLFTPDAIECTPCIILFIPEEQALFVVLADMFTGSPAATQAYFPGYYPSPALRTLPKITSSIY